VSNLSRVLTKIIFTVLIRIHNASFKDQNILLFDVNEIKLPIGSTSIFIGENGSGKTTLSYIIAQFWPHLVLNSLSAEILYDDHLPSLKEARQFWRKLSYTFQDPDCQYTELKVEDELDLMIPDRSQRDSIIAKYELAKFLNRNINTLSYGEKQRLLWAREFSSNKDFYLLDEVGSYLDSKWQEVLFNDLKELKKRGKTICIFGHFKKVITFDNIFKVEGKKIELLSNMPAFNNEFEYTYDKQLGLQLLSFSSCILKRGKTRIKFDINFTLSEKEIILINGDNGSGKSSLFLALAGIIQKPKNVINILFGTKVRIVFQNPYSQTIESSIESLISDININQLSDSFLWLKEIEKSRDPLSLSYGEQKAIHVLSALYSDAKIILIDELYTGLSNKMRVALEIEIIKSLNSGKGVVISSHPNIKDNLPYSKVINL
jgi:energy-coupling factor transport system ATP-binding protein